MSERATLTATAVRLRGRVLLIPDGQKIPDGAVVYGPARRDLVYQVFYEETHCRRGHRRVLGPGSVCVASVRSSAGCGRASGWADWTWGAPSVAVPDDERSEP